MKGNITPRKAPFYSFNELALVPVAVNGAGGAGAWVNKDISATVGTNPCWVEVIVRTAPGVAGGVRAAGSAVDKQTSTFGTDAWTQLVYSAAGIIEAYQNAAGSNYTIYLTGYWQ